MNVDLTVDGVIIDWNKPYPHQNILLIRRSKTSRAFPGMWALPGGKVEDGELLEEALHREIMEECGIKVAIHNMIGIYDAIERDPRGRKITIAYYCVPWGDVKIVAGDDAEDIGWFNLHDINLMKLAFDHYDIIRDALET